MVPTLKTLAPPGPPLLVASTVDHFQCYKVKRSKGAPKFQKILGVKVDDQFGTATLDLLKPVRLCALANKQNEDPTAPAHPLPRRASLRNDGAPSARRGGVPTVRAGPPPNHRRSEERRGGKG